MLVPFVVIAVGSAVVYGRMYKVNLRSRWGRVRYYENSISRVLVEESIFCLLPISTIIVIMFFYALWCFLILNHSEFNIPLLNVQGCPFWNSFTGLRIQSQWNYFRKDNLGCSEQVCWILNGSKVMVAESVVVLMGEKGWSFSKICGKSLVENDVVWNEKQ